MSNAQPLRSVEADESRCVAISGDAWLGVQCELPAGHEGLHQCRDHTYLDKRPRRWQTGARA